MDGKSEARKSGVIGRERGRERGRKKERDGQEREGAGERVGGRVGGREEGREGADEVRKGRGQVHLNLFSMLAFDTPAIALLSSPFPLRPSGVPELVVIHSHMCTYNRLCLVAVMGFTDPSL